MSIVKWLSWFGAAGWLLLVLFGIPLVLGQMAGMTEIVVGICFAAITSLPGWIIHFVQRRHVRANPPAG